MAKVIKRENEDIESLLRRFKRKVNDAGILHELKKREFYLSPSQKRREKRKEAELKKRKYERMQRRFTYRSLDEDDFKGRPAPKKSEE